MNYFLLGLVFIVVILLSPFLSVWALNTLFGHIGLAIPYSLETWVAALILNGYFVSSFKK